MKLVRDSREVNVWTLTLYVKCCKGALTEYYDECLFFSVCVQATLDRLFICVEGWWWC